MYSIAARIMGVYFALSMQVAACKTVAWMFLIDLIKENSALRFYYFMFSIGILIIPGFLLLIIGWVLFVFCMDWREIKKEPETVRILADIGCEQIGFTNNVSWLGDPNVRVTV